MEAVILPPKSMQVLVDLQKQLLSAACDRAQPAKEKAETPVPVPPKWESKPTQLMRHARVPHQAFQGFCRRGRRW